MSSSSASRRTVLIGAGLLGGLPADRVLAQPGVVAPNKLVDLGDEPWRLDPSGRQDCSEALERAARDNPGALLNVPPGQYRVDRTVRFGATALEGRFSAGLRLVGAGMTRTTFVSGVANGPMFMLDYAADAGFQAGLGIDLSEFSVRQRRGTSNGAGIALRSVFQARLSRLHIKGLSGDGITIACRRGDEDGSNMVALDQVRIEDCSGWGLIAAADQGANEISYLNATHVFVQGCGSAGRGGGIRWKGQSLTLLASAITLNRNAGLLIEGGPGLPNSALLLNTTFENNGGVSWLITGCQTVSASNVQIYVNGRVTPEPATYGLLIDGTSSACSNIAIEGAVMRATEADTGFTGFAARGQYADRHSIRVRRVNWQNFDHPGQRRFDGIGFDPVMANCALRVTDGTHIALKPVGRGNGMPLRLRGPAGGGNVPSTTGEWIDALLPAGGVSARAAALPPGRYHLYFFDRNGAVGLELSGTPPMLDPVSGYHVREDAPAYLHVGSVRIAGSGAALEIEPSLMGDA